MSTIHHRAETGEATYVTAEPARHITGFAARALAVLRIAFGLTFLWAFFDKLLALGFSTGAVTNDAGTRTGIDFFAKDGAWVNGGNPTKGFLTFGVPEHNPLQGTFNSMAGDAWVDWLFMLGLLGIGLALTLGVGMRIAAAAGALLYLLMWTASLPLENNPVIDDHILGAITVVVLALTYAGDTWGFGTLWARTRLVREYRFLR
jgi:thiosulfate dehydrogenase [quinone] large subunit